MRILLVFVCIILHTGLSYSQEGNCNNTLSGKILDTHDQTPLSGATIIVAGPEIAILSDLDGNFKISNLCNGEYTLQVSHPECSTTVFQISVFGNVSRNFKLEHHLESLNEIIIEGNAFSTKTESILENKLDEQDLEKFSGNSLGDALHQLSGVSSLNTGNSIVKPVINGLHSSRVTIINNGVRMQDQEWGAEHAPNIDINSAGRITVIKGASALQYTGDAIGGIVISEPLKIPIKDTLFGKSIFSTSTNGRGGSNTTSVIKGFDNGWFAQLQGTIKRYGDFEAPDYILSNTGSFERDGMIRLGQNKIDWGWEAHYSIFKNEIGILRASHLGGAEDQVNAINSNVPLVVESFTYEIGSPNQEVTHQTARFSTFKEFVNLGKVTVSYDFQTNERYEYDIRRGDDAEKPSVDLRLNTHNLTAGLESSINNLDFKTGAVINYQNNFANPNTGVRRLIPDYDQYKVGGYAIANWQSAHNLSVETGLRLDHTSMDVFKYYRTSFWEARGYDELFPEIVVEELDNQILANPKLDFTNLSATIGANYSWNDNWLIYANFSLASRAPNASELFSEGLHHSASRIELGDLRFDSEISKKVMLTLQKKGKTTFSINPFYNLLDNFIIIEPTGVEQTLRGNFQVWVYRQTTAEMMGIDIDISTPVLKNLDFSHTFSLVKAYEKETNAPLINIPPVSFSNLLTYETNKFTASLAQNYVFEQNEYPNTNFEVFIPETQTTEIVVVSTPPSAYQLWDIALSYDFNYSKNKTIEVGFKVQNLFNTAYRNYLNRLRYYADDLGRNVVFHTKINF